ncbi:ankyrin repeat domain-containing protein [Brevibacillus borstelensis]|uniref:ankyrin repeat domain-containing protein n=1 Tax=Brevibacillus borstelensis TaxID=45462 RepID=UPI003CC91FBC
MLAGCEEPVSTGEVAQDAQNIAKESEQKVAQGNAGRLLIAAAEKGETATVLELLKKGADINAADEKGRTAVLAATHGNHAETVKALIEAGADINIRDNRSDNVFLYAGAEGLLDIVKLAIEAGADPKLTNRYGGTALIPAAERGHVEVVEELLAHSGVDVNHVNNLGWTALMEAIVLSDGGEAHQKIVQLLINHGADVTIPDKDGVTPLAHAKKRGYREIEELLIKAGAR